MGRWIHGILITAALLLIGGFLSRSVAQGPYTLKLPLGLQEEAAYIPPNNPLTPEKIELGRQLFFDSRLSADGTVSCATCHAPDKGFSDGRPASLEDQALVPIQKTLQTAKSPHWPFATLSKISGYRKQFQTVFGT